MIFLCINIHFLKTKHFKMYQSISLYINAAYIIAWQKKFFCSILLVGKGVKCCFTMLLFFKAIKRKVTGLLCRKLRCWLETFCTVERSDRITGMGCAGESFSLFLLDDLACSRPVYALFSHVLSLISREILRKNCNYTGVQAMGNGSPAKTAASAASIECPCMCLVER